MKKIGISARRRAFLRTAVISAPAAVAAGAGAGAIAAHAATADATPYRPRYFSAAEWTVLNALVDRLIPADDQGPGALEAGVAEFIDLQMDTPYGKGALWYMDGPHDEQADALFGYQLSYAPRDLYRIALASFAAAVQQKYGKAFTDLDAAQQDQVVALLEQNKLAMDKVPAGVFFGQLLQNVHEGYFCDPVHGGNKGMAAWKMVGFPGARADYMDWVNQYGKRYPLPPVSLA